MHAPDIKVLKVYFMKTEKSLDMTWLNAPQHLEQRQKQFSITGNSAFILHFSESVKYKVITLKYYYVCIPQCWHSLDGMYF